MYKPGVIKLALSYPQGVTEAFQGVYDIGGPKGVGSLNIKMAEEAGSEIVAVVREHLNKVKQALTSRSNMDKSLKEEAVLAVSEMDCLLNKLGGMFLGLESTLEKVLTTA